MLNDIVQTGEGKHWLAQDEVNNTDKIGAHHTDLCAATKGRKNTRDMTCENHSVTHHSKPAEDTNFYPKDVGALKRAIVVCKAA